MFYIDSGEGAEPRSKRTWLGWFKAHRRAVLLALAGSLVLVFVLWLCAHAASRWVVEGEVAKIRAKGEGLSVAEFEPAPVPDEENMAIPLRRAFAALDNGQKVMGEDEALWDWDSYRWDPAKPFDVAKADKVLAIQAETLRLARVALDRPRCRFAVDYTSYSTINTWHLSKLDGLSVLFAADVRVKLRAGLVDQAADSAACILGLARALLEDPLLDSMLTGSGIVYRATLAIRALEQTRPFSTSVRQRVLPMLERADFAALLPSRMAMERAMCFERSEQIIGYPVEDDPPLLPVLRSSLLSFLLRFDRARLLSVLTEMTEASLGELRMAIPAMDSALARIRGALPPPLTRLSMKRWEYVNPCWDLLAYEGHRRAVILGLACELFRSKHGRCPVRLDELVPEFLDEVPPDPFTGKPFVYRLQKLKEGGKGFIVYSVGENLKDDGGRDMKASPPGDDIAWEGRKPK